MHFTSQLTWLTELAGRHQAGKSYAWARAKELEADPSGLWTGLPAALTAAMTNRPAGPALIQESVLHIKTSVSFRGQKSGTPSATIF